MRWITVPPDKPLLFDVSVDVVLDDGCKYDDMYVLVPSVLHNALQVLGLNNELVALFARL